MSVRPVCEVCGRSSSVGSLACTYCGRPFYTLEESASGIIGAPVWGKVDIRILNVQECHAIAARLGAQWETQEQLPTQQLLFPGQARVFVPGKKAFKVFAPLWSFEELARYVNASLPGKVDVKFTELPHEEIYRERDAWSSAGRET
jgi:hypothetical protein